MAKKFNKSMDANTKSAEKQDLPHLHCIFQMSFPFLGF
jgi:hypothetical protein